MIATRSQSFFWQSSLWGLLLLAMVAALFLGAYQLNPREVMNAIIDTNAGTNRFLILQIRAPRILLAALTGAGLAVSGAAIQGLFRNPLADQTLIGVTSGAMLFAVLSIVLAGSLLSWFSVFFRQASIAIFAFLGGLVTTFLVYRLSSKQGRTEVTTMLLAGIAISAFAAAVSGVFIYMSDDQQLRDITFWSLGSMSGANWGQFMLVAPIILFCILVLLRYSTALNAILLGEKEASYLGIQVERVKSQVILLTALIVGVCIAMSGIIGFVGLIIPHFLRLIQGTDYRLLLKNAALGGAIFLVVADTLARTIVAPAELPIGILTSLVGAPFFLWLLLRSKSQKLVI